MLSDDNCFRCAAFAVVMRVTGIVGVGEGVRVACETVEDAWHPVRKQSRKSIASKAGAWLMVWR
jgi:hypothetical protein